MLRYFGSVLHSSDELYEVSQWICRDDSNMNIVMTIVLMLLLPSLVPM